MKFYIIYGFLFISCSHHKVLDLNQRNESNQKLSKKIRCEYEESNESEFDKLNLKLEKEDIPQLTPFSEKKVTHICFWSSTDMDVFIGCDELNSYELDHGISKTYDKILKISKSTIFAFGNKEMIKNISLHNIKVGDSLIPGYHMGYDNFIYYANKNNCNIIKKSPKREISNVD